MKIDKLKTFFMQEEAATAVEYAILLMLIVLAISRAALLLGQTASDAFESTANAMP